MINRKNHLYKFRPAKSLYSLIIIFFSFFWFLSLLVYLKGGNALEAIILIPIIVFMSCLFISKYGVLIDGDRCVIFKPFRRDVEFNAKSIKQLVLPMDEDINKTVLSKPYELLIILEGGKKITLNMKLFKMTDIVVFFKYISVSRCLDEGQ